MNVGIIGGGNISDTHARASQAAGLDVVAVFGDNHDKALQLGARYNAAVYENLQDLLQHRGLDIVMIGSPSGCHAEHAIAAARCGHHVLVEKPLDISTDRIDRLLEEVAKAAVTLGVFFQDRLKPDVAIMKTLIDAGEIGTPVMATGEVKWFRSPDYYATSRWRGTWALDGGGALMNQGIHTVDLLLYLLGPVVRVTGITARRFHTIEAEDTASATFEFANGALGAIEATTAACPGKPRRLGILGSEGSLVLEGDRLVETHTRDSLGQAGTKTAGLVGATPENVTSPVVSDANAHQRIIEDFVEAIRDRRAPVCDGREGRRSVEVVEAVYRSAQEKRQIELKR